MADISRTNSDLPVIIAGNKFSNVVGNGTAVVKSGAGALTSIMINNNSTGGTVVIYDNTAASGTIIASLQFGSPSGGLLTTSGMPGPTALGPLGIQFSTGLTVLTAGSTANNVTLVYI